MNFFFSGSSRAAEHTDADPAVQGSYCVHTAAGVEARTVRLRACVGMQQARTEGSGTDELRTNARWSAKEAEMHSRCLLAERENSGLQGTSVAECIVGLFSASPPGRKDASARACPGAQAGVPGARTNATLSPAGLTAHCPPSPRSDPSRSLGNAESFRLCNHTRKHRGETGLDAAIFSFVEFVAATQHQDHAHDDGKRGLEPSKPLRCRCRCGERRHSGAHELACAVLRMPGPPVHSPPSLQCAGGIEGRSARGRASKGRRGLLSPVGVIRNQRTLKPCARRRLFLRPQWSSLASYLSYF